MPWKERTRMEQRVEFIGALASRKYTMTELCEAFGISRKTGYKWAARYGEEGLDGLKDRSRAPHHCPHRSDPRCEEALVAARRRRPHWGARKLLVVLKKQHPEWPWPAPSTAGAILQRHGLVEARRRRRRREPVPKPRFRAERPNEMWTADFKGEFRLGDRELCYPLTIADRSSRYLLACEGQTSTAIEPARRVFERMFSDYGLPEKILTDSGTPFAAAQAVRRLSRLSVWWVQLGIEPILIQPGHPEQNGCHERMHRTLKAQTACPPAANRQEQQRLFDDFRTEYNEERPHEALEMSVPAALYERSSRTYSAPASEMEYPGHFELRRVRTSGEIKWQGRRLFLSEVLRGNTVGLEETDDRLWSVYFGPLLIARYDEREPSHLDRL